MYIHVYTDASVVSCFIYNGSTSSVSCRVPQSAKAPERCAARLINKERDQSILVHSCLPDNERNIDIIIRADPEGIALSMRLSTQSLTNAYIAVSLTETALRQRKKLELHSWGEDKTVFLQSRRSSFHNTTHRPPKEDNNCANLVCNKWKAYNNK